MKYSGNVLCSVMTLLFRSVNSRFISAVSERYNYVQECKTAKNAHGNIVLSNEVQSLFQMFLNLLI
jgi:hypothetical protein